MDKSAITASAGVLLMLLLCTACDVYDPTLTRANEDRRGGDAGRPIDAAFTEESDDAGDETSDSRGEHCGNGLIDPSERCDVAIARGRPGACPDGCSGREGCIARELIGHACNVRCIDIEITEAISGDGCCPDGASAATDDDCTGVCGNEVVERGERCDPPSSCAQKDDCVAEDACQSAHYTGDAERCTASCELRPIHACVKGDGCCPPGCSHAADGDCESPADAAPSCTEDCEPTGRPEPAPEPPSASDCQIQHPGGSCEECDCQMCQAETMACLTGPGDDGEKCEAVIRCASEAECVNLECLCGPANAQRCPRWPVGPCVSEIRAAGGAQNVYQLIATASLQQDSALGRAVAVMSCRQRECRRACEL